METEWRSLCPTVNRLEQADDDEEVPCTVQPLQKPVHYLKPSKLNSQKLMNNFLINTNNFDGINSKLIYVKIIQISNTTLDVPVSCSFGFNIYYWQ